MGVYGQFPRLSQIDLLKFSVFSTLETLPAPGCGNMTQYLSQCPVVSTSIQDPSQCAYKCNCPDETCIIALVHQEIPTNNTVCDITLLETVDLT